MALRNTFWYLPTFIKLNWDTEKIILDRAVGHLLPGLLLENPSLSNVETESIKIENQLLLYPASLHLALGPFLDMKIKSALKKSNCVYRGRNLSGILLFTYYILGSPASRDS